MGKHASAISVIGGADGPTSVFLLKRNQKLTLKQKLHKFKYNLKRAHVEKTLKPGGHTLDEVMTYLVKVHGFAEFDKEEIKGEYEEMRASFLLQHAPELLGEYATLPPLKSESQEDLLEYMWQAQERVQRAKEIHQYYGVTEEDIRTKSQRYKEVVRALCRK